MNTLNSVFMAHSPFMTPPEYFSKKVRILSFKIKSARKKISPKTAGDFLHQATIISEPDGNAAVTSDHIDGMPFHENASGRQKI